MFGAPTGIVLAAMLVASLLSRQTPLFILTLALLLAAGLARLWDRFCLTGLEYRRHFKTRRTGFGETIELDVEIVNRKLLPLAWVEIEDEIPVALAPDVSDSNRSASGDRTSLRRVIALRPFERVRRRYHLRGDSRGEHQFGPVRIRTGDLFGLVTRELVLEVVDVIVVLPRVVPLAELGLPSRQPLGDLKSKSWIFDDPSRIAGIREHRPGDSLRRVNWAASARSQRLQVRVFEPTTTHDLAIFLNLRSAAGDWWGYRYDPDALELAISTAASVASWALANGFRVSLTTNGLHRLRSGPVATDPTTDPARRIDILDALGRLQPLSARPFAGTLAEGSRRLTYGTTVVAVGAVFGEVDVAQLIALRRRGHPVALLVTGRATPPISLAGIVVRSIGPPEAWRTLDILAPVASR